MEFSITIIYPPYPDYGAKIFEGHLLSSAKVQGSVMIYNIPDFKKRSV